MAYKSFLEPKTCGFYRTAAYLVANKEELCGIGEKNIQKSLTERYDEFCALFKEDIEYKFFMVSANRLRKSFQSWGKTKKEKRATYISNFHPKIYEKLPENKKVEHTLENCKGCQDINFLETQSTFPVNSKAMKNSIISRENPFNVSAAINTNMTKAKEKDVKKCTKKIYDLVNEPFKRSFGISFAEGITGIKEVNMMRKPSDYQKKKEKRKIITQVKRSMENHWESNAVER